MQWAREMGDVGWNGEGDEEIGRSRDGRSAGLCSEGIHRRWIGAVDLAARSANSRRSFARCGAWAPDLKVSMAWMEVVESEIMQGLGWKERASLRVCRRE